MMLPTSTYRYLMPSDPVAGIVPLENLQLEEGDRK